MTPSGFGESWPAKFGTAVAAAKTAAGFDALPRKSDAVDEARGWVFFGALVACAVAASGNLVSAVVEQRPDAWIAVAIVVAIFLSSLVASIAGFAFSVLAGRCCARLRRNSMPSGSCGRRSSGDRSGRWWAGAATIPVGVWLLVHAAQDAHLVPFALLGAMGGLALFRRMTNNQFQRVVSTLLLFSGLGLLVRASLKAY